MFEKYLNKIRSIISPKTKLLDKDGNEVDFKNSIELKKGELQDFLVELEQDLQTNKNILNNIDELKKSHSDDDVDGIEFDSLSKIKDLTKAISEVKVELSSLKKKYADAIVYNQKGEILFLLRGNETDFEPGKLGLPGGHIDEGEDSETAVKREVLEETNCEVKSCQLVGELKTKDVEISYFVCQLEEENLLILDTEEHFNYKWLSLDELNEEEAIKGLKDKLEELLNPVQHSVKILKKAFELGQISEEKYLEVLQKASNHKYLKREGVKGDYTYIYSKEQKYEKAHKLLDGFVESIEKKLNIEETNRETIKEGNNIFQFKSMFSDENNKVSTKYFEVSLGNSNVQEVNKNKGEDKEDVVSEHKAKIEKLSDNQRRVLSDIERFGRVQRVLDIRVLKGLVDRGLVKEVKNNKFEPTTPFSDKDFDNIKAVLNKSEDSAEEFEKAGKTAQLGEVREWNGQKMEKTAQGWVPVRGNKKGGKEEEKKKSSGKKKDQNKEDGVEYTPEQLSAHAKESSTESLQKVAEDKNSEPQLQQAAQQELQERGVEPSYKQKLKEKAKDWHKKQIEYYQSGALEPNSEDRKGLKNLLVKKKDGIIKALKEEVHEFKEAGSGLKKFFSGKTDEMTSHEKKAIKTISIHLGIVIGSMALTGGLAGAASKGIGALGKGIVAHYLEHAGLTKIGHVLAFAKAESELTDEEIDKILSQLIDEILKHIESGNISEEDWLKIGDKSSEDFTNLNDEEDEESRESSEREGKFSYGNSEGLSKVEGNGKGS